MSAASADTDLEGTCLRVADGARTDLCFLGLEFMRASSGRCAGALATLRPPRFFTGPPLTCPNIPSSAPFSSPGLETLLSERIECFLAKAPTLPDRCFIFPGLCARFFIGPGLADRLLIGRLSARCGLCFNGPTLDDRRLGGTAAPDDEAAGGCLIGPGLCARFFMGPGLDVRFFMAPTLDDRFFMGPGLCALSLSVFFLPVRVDLPTLLLVPTLSSSSLRS